MITSRYLRLRSWQFVAQSLCVLISAALACPRLAPADELVPNPTATESGVKYVEAHEQLIVELYVRDVKRSTSFYEKLGFKAVRTESDFVELGWDDSRLYLEQIPGQPDPPATLVANVRIMVPDVDRYWKLCQEMKLPVQRAIGDRYYGLRDFTVVSPDGIGLRFAAKLGKKATP